ncbi:MAG: hypothetical protein ACJATN_000871, partial [Neolewinella sp.]
VGSGAGREFLTADRPKELEDRRVLIWLHVGKVDAVLGYVLTSGPVNKIY